MYPLFMIIKIRWARECFFTQRIPTYIGFQASTIFKDESLDEEQISLKHLIRLTVY